MKEIWRNLDDLPKNKELWSYVVKFEFSRPKVAQMFLCLKSMQQCLRLPEIKSDILLEYPLMA